MKKRKFVRIISFSLALLIVSSAFAVKSAFSVRRYRLELENGYSQSLDEFHSAINNISVTLNKARFLTSPEQLSQSAAKLLTEAEVSKNALSQLPNGKELTTLNKFLSQVGNYAMSVSKDLISGKELSAEHSQNIEHLSSAAKKISQAVNDTQITYNNAEYWASELDGKINQNIDVASLSASFDIIEEDLSDYPTLVYDGPYSDHILEKKPAMLEKAESVTEATAQNTAAVFAECDKNALKADGSVDGNIPAYRFSGNNTTVTVSKRGGFAVFMRKDRAISKTIISYEQAITKAKRYLEKVKLTSLQETYYFTTEGVCVINFAFRDGETICYTDLIKVGVAMDTGEIMLFEASGYISNHTERAFETPQYTAEQAREMLSPKLTVNNTALALIPTNSGGEVRCYEFSCASEDGQYILIYINATTLKEEEILILLKSDGGTLVK